ncbi:MAG: hypothetical protein HYX24_01240 [Candidatus Aenigmarchaeota archaeon]|nr:hypothetical protein [Candidatus Aenigmarchaeota archaeon]
MEGWKKARDETYPIVKELARIAPGYSYEDEGKAIATDQKVTDVIVRALRSCKNRLFFTIQLLYELQHESLNNGLEDLRDEIDIFSDEIKARRCKWSYSSVELLKKLVRQDYRFITMLKELDSMLETVHNDALEMKEIRYGHKAEFEPGKVSRLKQDIKKAFGMVQELVVLFREREAICNLEAATLEKTFERISRQLEGG